MATKESLQKKLGRVRPPRVHITYDVHTGGAIEKREIPFVVGVLADLSGMPEEPLPKMKDPKRKFTEIDRDNFDQVMAKQKPRIVFKVNNKLGGDKDLLPVELKFEKLADFEPQNVAKQVKPMKDLLELRAKLSNLRSSLFGNDKLEELLQDAISQTEAQGQGGGAPSSGEPEKKG
jgi:type VI secretion system protein ImpB